MRWPPGNSRRAALFRPNHAQGIIWRPAAYALGMKRLWKSSGALAAALVFILATALKMAFPGAAASVREYISQDSDYASAITALAEAVTGDEVREAFMRLAGRESGPDMPEYYSPGTVEAYIEAARAALPPPSAAPEPESTPAPTASPEAAQETVPEAVAAFLKAQEPFTGHAVPSNVSYGYPELPFDYVSPVAGATSSGFGYRLHPLRDEVLFHYGTDFAVWTGTPILAFASGTVGMVGWDSGFGNYIIVMHPGGWRTLYAHCSEVYVTGGDEVTAGKCIGLVGATGNVTGPHLHLELTCDGVYYNPEFYIT